jgi:hypothetical protein
MKSFALQFFRNVPGAIGLNAAVAIGSAAVFFVGYELVMSVKFFGYVRSLQVFAAVAVMAGLAWFSPQLLRSLLRWLRPIITPAKGEVSSRELDGWARVLAFDGLTT